MQLCPPGHITEAQAPCAVELVAIDSLRTSYSPRLNGISERHAELLAECPGELPAVLVQKGTMRVIDGMHRVHAARLKVRETIAVQFVDVDDDAAFLLAVEANIAHGLPLSLADRKAAAVRILQARPHWSDRAIARASGLSWKTVGSLRARAQAPADVAGKRVGQDGKARPVSGAAGRRLAGDLLSRNPEAALREIARAAGVSAATVRDVRDRLSRGEDVLTPAQLRQCAQTAERATPELVTVPSSGEGRSRLPAGPRPAHPPARDYSIVSKLKADPSVRYSNAGRALLHLLHARPSALHAHQLIKATPAHCLTMVAQVSRQIALEWLDLAVVVEARARRVAEGARS